MITSELDTRLDSLEHRLHELEAELADLRTLAEAGFDDTDAADAVFEPSPLEPPEPEPLRVPPGRIELPGWALHRLDQGDFRGLFKDIERACRIAVAENDIEELLVLNLVVLLTRERAPVGVDARAAELGQAIRQNIRFLARKLGVEVDEAALGGPTPEPEPEPAEQVAAEELSERAEKLEPPLVRTEAWRGEHETRPRAPALPAPPRPPRITLPEVSASDLLGAKALAITGGIVTLLGIVFFFILAVNRGWIGPEGRIALGAAAATAVYVGGLALRRRYGETDASLAAVAAGIAGGYTVLLAAAQLYHFVGDVGALFVAVGIAAVGLATALRWRSQILAGIGLLGAMLAPVAVALQDGISSTGVSFAAFMAIATAVVSLRERWNVLLVVGAGVSLTQGLVLAMQAEYRGQSPADVVALSAVLAAITAGTGIAGQLRERSRELRPLPTWFLFVGTTYAVACALRLYGTSESRGFALLAVAVALLAAAAVFVPRPHDRDLSALLGALGLVVGGIAFGELMSGSPLAFAWAGEAAALAWLALRVRDIRYQLWGLAYFGAAVVHVLAVDVPPSHLFKPLETSAGGALAVVAVGASAALIALQTWGRPVPFAKRRGIFAPLSPILLALGGKQRELRVLAWCISALAAVYALSLGVLAAFASFDWGHAAMYTLWSAIGLGLYGFGLRGKRDVFRAAGIAALVLTDVAAIANGLDELGTSARAAACLVAGLALLGATLTELFVVLAPHYRRLSADARLLGLGSAWATAVLSVAALSVGIVAAIPSYDWGRVAMFATWSALALGVAHAAFRRRAWPIRSGAIVGLIVTDIAAIWTGVAILGRDARATSCLVAGGALLLAALVELFLFVAPRYGKWERDEGVARLGFAWTQAVTSVAALSVGIVAAIPSYDWGRVSMFVLWTALGLGVLLAALARRAPQVAAGGVWALGITVAVSFPVGYRYLDSTPRGVTFVVVGAAVLAAAVALQLVPRVRRSTPAAFGFVLASAGVGLAAIISLFDGAVDNTDERGLAILVLAGLYAVLAVGMYGREGQRDFSTLLWGTALVIGYGASARLLPETYHVLVVALAAVGLAWLSRRAAEPRFLAAAAGALVVDLSTVLFSAAPPSHLFVAGEHPGRGAIGALFVAAASVAVGLASGEETELRRRFRVACYWTAGVLTVYGLSIFILAFFQAVFAGSVDTNFHRGHTSVSAFWGLIGLALLYVGLTRYRALRVAGFVMFAVSLAKIFLFDLPSLSSITRALSFLAVGAVLLLGGFFYQRLATAQSPQPKRVRRPAEWPESLRRVDLWLCLAAAAILVVWFGTGSAPLGLA